MHDNGEIFEEPYCDLDECNSLHRRLGGIEFHYILKEDRWVSDIELQKSKEDRKMT